MTFIRVLGTEFAKLRRSAVTWATLGAYALMGGGAALFMWMIRNPEAAKGLGLIGMKAELTMGTFGADWNGLFDIAVLMGAIGGIVVLSVIVIFIFGREYAQGTAKNMLALPVRRAWFVLAKLLVAAAWFAALTAVLLAEMRMIGGSLGLGALPPGLLAEAAGRLFGMACLCMALQPVVALVTVRSGGYLAPFGFMLLTLFLGNVFAKTGWAPWFPWSIIPLLIGMAGPAENVGAGSYVVLAALFAAGLGGTMAHQESADNCQ